VGLAAAESGLYGAAEEAAKLVPGESLGDIAERAKEGGEFGALLGGGLRAGLGALGAGYGAVRNYINPQREIAQKAQTTALGKGQMTLEEFEQAAARGLPVSITDLPGGRSMVEGALGRVERSEAPTAQKLQEFRERDLSGFTPFAVYIDTIHRGNEAFIVALGVSLQGEKLALGFWQGATENSDICVELFNDLERRGLKLVKRILWVTDGGSGVGKALRDRFGNKLIHQRCTIHKDRNIQKHLPKTCRKEAHRQFRVALEQTSYQDAQQMLLEFEMWLRRRNESAANSLLEAFDEILTLHRLKVPVQLRKALHSTNPIESMFATVREMELNIKYYRGSKMMQRWLATVLLQCEHGFRRVKGHESIGDVVKTIEKEQEGESPVRSNTNLAA
jgi:hypothetical protein